MTECYEQDLTGARFGRVGLRGTRFTEVFLSDAEDAVSWLDHSLHQIQDDSEAGLVVEDLHAADPEELWQQLGVALPPG